ncbi:MAG: tetratricopeptide repeat protein [Candidatus Peregrinibacteria bacterium]
MTELLQSLNRLSRQPFLWVLLLSLIIIAVFSPFISAHFLMLDDGLLVTENPLVLHTSPWAVSQAFRTFDPELYIPFTILSYQLDALVGGIDPFVFHLHNVLLHIANVCLVYFLLKALKIRPWMALAAAAVFAVHPIQTEAVLWISARKDLQSAFFFLSSLLAYLFWMDHREESFSLEFYWLSLMLFLFGLLSKVSIAPLPMVLLILHLERRQAFRQWIAPLVPFTLMALIMIGVGMIGKSIPLNQLYPSSFFLLASRSFWFTVQHLLFPVRLSPFYPLLNAFRFVTWPFIACSILTVMTLSLLTMLHRRQSPAVFPLLGFLIMLVPGFFTFWKSGIIYLTSDRYAYIPLFFALLFIVRLFPAHPSRFVRWTPVSLIIILPLLSLLTFRQAMLWQTDATLFSSVLQTSENHIALLNLGNVRLHQGDLPGALGLYLRSIDAKPGYPVAYRNAGTVLIRLGRFDQAKLYFRSALALSPAGTEAHLGLGFLYKKQGNLKEAEKEFLAAADSDFTKVSASLALGDLAYERDDREGARAYYEKVLKIDPENELALTNLAVIDEEERRAAVGS